MQNDLRQRTQQFALRVIRLFAALPKREECRIIGRQLVRSGTSVGANYREACAARSKDEFTAKLGVCHQELEETAYWLELLVESGFIPGKKLESLMAETQELTAIIVTSIKTAKGK